MSEIGEIEQSWAEKVDLYGTIIFDHFKNQVDDLTSDDEVERAIALIAIGRWVADGQAWLLSEGEMSQVVAVSFLNGYVMGRAAG